MFTDAKDDFEINRRSVKRKVKLVNEKEINIEVPVPERRGGSHFLMDCTGRPENSDELIIGMWPFQKKTKEPVG